jgi:hypothetical protein
MRENSISTPSVILTYSSDDTNILRYEPSSPQPHLRRGGRVAPFMPEIGAGLASTWEGEAG